MRDNICFCRPIRRIINALAQQMATASISQAFPLKARRRELSASIAARPAILAAFSHRGKCTIVSICRLPRSRRLPRNEMSCLGGIGSLEAGAASDIIGCGREYEIISFSTANESCFDGHFQCEGRRSQRAFPRPLKLFALASDMPLPGEAIGRARAMPGGTIFAAERAEGVWL